MSNTTQLLDIEKQWVKGYFDATADSVVYPQENRMIAKFWMGSFLQATFDLDLDRLEEGQLLIHHKAWGAPEVTVRVGLQEAAKGEPLNNDYLRKVVGRLLDLHIPKVNKFVEGIMQDALRAILCIDFWDNVLHGLEHGGGSKKDNYIKQYEIDEVYKEREEAVINLNTANTYILLYFAGRVGPPED